ncbi:MAG: GNAT family N-acetyltransferase [Fimbriimonas sp.]
MSDEATLRIRPIRPEDVLPLEALGHRAPGLAAHRLGEQGRGHSLVFIAFIDDEIVGHAVLTWVPESAHVADCPDVSDVWVQPRWRRHGIGTSLLEACEHVARDQGFRQIGLSVGVDNEGAAALYRQHGYDDVGLEPYIESGRWTDAKGELVEWSERCRYLRKPLPYAEGV